MKNDQDLREHLKRGIEDQEINTPYTIKVQAKTLESIVDQHIPNKKIDFLSLDLKAMNYRH